MSLCSVRTQRPHNTHARTRTHTHANTCTVKHSQRARRVGAGSAWVDHVSSSACLGRCIAKATHLVEHMDMHMHIVLIHRCALVALALARMPNVPISSVRHRGTTKPQANPSPTALTRTVTLPLPVFLERVASVQVLLDLKTSYCSVHVLGEACTNLARIRQPAGVRCFLQLQLCSKLSVSYP